MLSTFSNISSETTGQIEAKFDVEPPWDVGTKVYSNGPGHMTKMAPMLIYRSAQEKSSFYAFCRRTPLARNNFFCREK